MQKESPRILTDPGRLDLRRPGKRTRVQIGLGIIKLRCAAFIIGACSILNTHQA